MEQGGLMAFLYLGAKHMVTGYDHLLFLFGVIFFLYRLRDVVNHGRTDAMAEYRRVSDRFIPTPTPISSPRNTRDE